MPNNYPPVNINQGNPSNIEWQQYMKKRVKITLIDGQNFNGYLDGMDNENIILVLPIQSRQEDDAQSDNRAYGYGGFGPYGYGGYGYGPYGYGGYGPYGYGHGPYGYGGFGYGPYGYGRFGVGRLLLPLAAITAIGAL